MTVKKTKTIKEKVMSVLARRKTPATPQQIQNAINSRYKYTHNANSVRRELYYLQEAGKVQKTDAGWLI